MPKFEFTLERIRKIRRQQEKAAETAEARARRAADAALDRLQARRIELSAKQSEFQSGMRAVAAHEFAAYCDLTAQMVKLIALAEVDWRAACKVRDEAVAERIRLSAQVEMLNRYHDEQYDEYRREVNKREQELIDEAGLLLRSAAIAS